MPPNKEWMESVDGIRERIRGVIGGENAGAALAALASESAVVLALSSDDYDGLGVAVEHFVAGLRTLVGDAWATLHQDGADTMPTSEFGPREAGTEVAVSPDALLIAPWSPAPNVAPTQLHLIAPFGDDGAELVIRLKTRRGADTLIATVARHADDVWGKRGA